MAQGWSFSFIIAAAAAAGAEAADGPWRNCGTAAVVYSSSHLAEAGGGGTHTGSASSRPDSRFLFFETY